MYTEKVMDHFQHPRNMGEIENASGVGTVGNAKCGDIMRIYLDIRLRSGSCHKQYGYRAGERKEHPGGHGSNE